MSLEDTSQSDQHLVDLFKTIDAAGNTEQEILRHLIARVSERDAELGDLIRCCGIPRRFNAEVIGVLREMPQERETNGQLLAKILSFSFVRVRPDGSYTFHDGTRDLILEDWRTPDNRDRFDHLNQQLVTFYKDQYERVLKLEQDLFSVARVIQLANPTRYVQLTSIFETRIFAPLLEVLYHKSLQSPEACYRYFERLYQDQEKAGRLMVRESLLNATRDYLERLPANSGQEEWLKWLQYWKGRYKLEIRQDSKAEKILVELLAQTGDDDINLKLWVLGDLGATYYQQGKLKEARDTYQQVLDLANETGKDPYNLPVWYSRLGQLHWALEELDEAEEKYREAIKYAQGTNVGLEISTRIDLSGVLYARGRLPEALNTIIDTLHLARTELPSDRGSYRAVIQQLMNLLARREARLLDTVFAEAEASLADTIDPVARLRFRQQYISLLRQSGQLRRADEHLTKLVEGAREQKNEILNNDLLLEKALLLEAQGHLGKAAEANHELAQRAAVQEGGAWNCAAAISNCGMLRAKLALWPQAEADIREAIDKWRAMSHDKLEAFMRSSLATALRQQGRLPEAQQSLDAALSVLAGTPSGYLFDVYQEQGEVFRTQGRNEEARRQYEQALEGYRRLDHLEQAARTLGNLATLAADQGDWEEAARQTAESNKCWQKLAKINSYRPSSEAERADEENANGVQAFFTTDDDRLERIREASGAFRSAIKTTPDNFWYYLNLAYGSAELEEWSEAAEAVKSALTVSPEWLRAQMVYERLADYHANQGEKIFSAGRYEEAAQFYDESRRQLEGHVAFERLAEVQLRLSDSLLELGRLDQAQTEYAKGLAEAEKAESADSAMFQASFHARLGFLGALQSDLSNALEHLRASIKLGTPAVQTEVVEELVTCINEFADLITSTAQYRVLGEALRILVDDRVLGAAQRQRLIEAQFDLSRFRYQVTRRPSGELPKTTTGAGTFSVIPILLEADGGLFPLGEKTPEVDRMIQVDIPTMRQERLYKPTGVIVPGVRIRANDDLKGGLYVLLLDEIPVESGTVFANEKFCLDAARCRELGIEGRIAFNPGGGPEGMWLAETACERAESNGLALQDPYQYMVIHLGALLRRELASFLGVEEVQNMLTQWVAESEEDRQELFEKAVPDEGATVRLAQVLRHLVKEDVSIRNLSTILATFAEANSTLPELIDVIESVRAALRSDLPVSKGGWNLIGLSENFETAIARGIQQQEHKRFLAMPKEEGEKLITSLQSHIADRADNLVLIVAKSDLRPFVWRLLRGVYPNLLVSSAGELPEGTTLPDQRINLSAENAMRGARDVSFTQEPIELEVDKETSHPEQFFPQRFINRQVEQEVFAQLLQFKDESRLLTITDKSGTGKTALLKMFEYRCRYSHTTAVSYTSLEDSTLDDPFNLVRKIRRDLFNLTFVSFDRLDLARVTRDFSAFSAENEPLVTANPPAQIVARAADWGSEQEEFARLECINAFFADLEIISGKEPAAILLDSFERSDPELREWIVKNLIPRLFDGSQPGTRLVLVLAGRELPDFRPIFGDRYYQVVRSIGPLSVLSAQDLEAFLRAEGYGTLGDKDLSLLLDKAKAGIPLADTLRLARLMASGRLP